MMESLMNHESEDSWKEIILTHWSCGSKILLEGLRKTMETLVRVAIVPDEIQTKYMPGSSSKHWETLQTISHFSKYYWNKS
jgi:hypothetical protein